MHVNESSENYLETILMLSSYCIYRCDERNLQRHHLYYIGDVCRVRSCIIHPETEKLVV